MQGIRNHCLYLLVGNTPFPAEAFFDFACRKSAFLKPFAPQKDGGASYGEVVRYADIGSSQRSGEHYLSPHDDALLRRRSPYPALEFNGIGRLP